MPLLSDEFVSCPVLINLSSGGSGSGFYFCGGKYLYFVTAAHVLFDLDTQEPRSENLILTSFNGLYTDRKRTVVEVNFNKLISDKNCKAIFDYDVAVTRIGYLKEDRETQSNFTIVEGVEPVEDNGIVGPTINEVRLFKDIIVSSDIFVMGYPSSIGLKDSPQFDYDAPLLRKGIVAGKYPENKTIILDSAVYYGNSGGPVIDIVPVSLTLAKVSLIGVVTQFIPYEEKWINLNNKIQNIQVTNSGYSVCVCLDVFSHLLQ